MNSRGVLFAAMVFLLLLSLLSLQQQVRSAGYSAQASESAMHAFMKAQWKLSGLRSSLALLGSGADGNSSDVLPFSFLIDGNSLHLSSSLPREQARIDAYLSALNSFRVLLEDTNHSRQYDSLQVDMNAPTPPSWGGSATGASFATQPQCMRYSMPSSTSAGLDFACAGFDFNAMRRLDLNMAFSDSHKFKSMDCAFNGSSSCPDSAYDPSSALPYLNLKFDDSNCSKCTFSQKNVRVHFNPGLNNYVRLRCVGGDCDSTDLELAFSTRTTFSFSGPEISFSLRADLNSGINSFGPADTNISVANTNFGARAWKTWK